MDIALILDKLVPAAKYGGSLTNNTKEAFEALRWEDSREKPSWTEIERLAGELENEIQFKEQIKQRINNATEIYNSAPIAFQEMFYNSFLFISNLAQAGRMAEAIALIEGKPVPEEIENTKQLLLQALKGE